MASSMPTAACCMPRRALSGRVSDLRPRMKRMEAAWIRYSVMPGRVRRSSARRARLVDLVRAPEHLQHAVGDDEAAHDVDGGGGDGDGAQQRAQRAVVG